MLEAKQLFKRYGENEILTNVSVCVKSGAVTVIMGPSGGGKSTLVRSMSMLETPDNGEISLNGQKLDIGLNSWPSKHISPWPQITVVFQQLFLWPNMTLAENATLPAELRKLSLKKYPDLIERLGIESIMSRYPNQVSVGQRQRAALVRALLLQPRFLLLDEITAALDVEQISALTTILIDYLEQKMGLMIVTHHLGFARTLLQHGDAGSFVFLESGKVIESGDVDGFVSPSTERVRQFLATIRSVA